MVKFYLVTFFNHNKDLANFAENAKFLFIKIRGLKLITGKCQKQSLISE